MTQGPGTAPGQNIEQLLANIPPQVKQQVVQMKQQGSDPHAIMSYLMQHIAAIHQAQGGGQPQPGGPPANGGAPPAKPAPILPKKSPLGNMNPMQ
jgi:hypothetical protein